MAGILIAEVLITDQFFQSLSEIKKYYSIWQNYFKLVNLFLKNTS